MPQQGNYSFITLLHLTVDKFCVGVAVVYFGQSSAHALRPPYTLASAHEQLATLSGLVSWRHLHQRLPALLGRFSLAGILGSSEVELTLNMPITCDSGITVAHVRLCLQMGRDKLYFGKALLGSSLHFLEVCATGHVGTVQTLWPTIPVQTLNDTKQTG